MTREWVGPYTFTDRPKTARERGSRGSKAYCSSNTGDDKLYAVAWVCAVCGDEGRKGLGGTGD